MDGSLQTEKNTFRSIAQIPKLNLLFFFDCMTLSSFIDASAKPANNVFAEIFMISPIEKDILDFLDFLAHFS